MAKKLDIQDETEQISEEQFVDPTSGNRKEN
jgi:hypothetical protein